MLSPTSMKAFSSELKKIAKMAVTDEDVKDIEREVDLWNKLRDASPVKVKKDHMADLHGGAYFDQQAKEIGLSRKDYESLAHEIGHAELDKKLIGKIIQHPHMRTAYGLTPGAGAIAGALLAKGKKKGLLLPVATIAPTLASELWATHKGGKSLEEAGASEEEVKKYKKNLHKSFGSYLTPALSAAALGGLTYAAAK